MSWLGSWARRAAILLVLAATGTHDARAIEYPSQLRLPSWDWSVGLAGGVAFGEGLRAGASLGLDAGFHHGVLGLNLGFRATDEGATWRLGGLLEATAWYVVLFGVGVRLDSAVGELGAVGEAPERTLVALTFLLALPIPVWRLPDGGGSLILMPYGRPGLRFHDDPEDGLRGFHEVGLSLRWSSF